MNDHPLVYLARCRCRHASLRGAGLLSLLFLLAAGLVPSARALLLTLAAGVWPAVFTAQTVTSLGSRGQELDAMPVSVRQLVDGLALWLGLRSWPAMVLLALVVRTPSALGLGLVIAYLGMLGWIWSDGEDDMLPRALAGAVCLAPALALLATGSLGLATLAALLGLRTGCLVGWHHAARLARAWRGFFRARPGRSKGLGARVEDPLIYRELRRTVGRTFLPLLLLPLALWAGTISLAAHGLSTTVLTFSVGVLLLLVQSMRAGWSTVGCLADEREGRTLEALLGTRLQARDFVEAWGRWGGGPILLETLVLGALLSGLLPLLKLSATLGVVLLCSAGAAYAGVAASAGAGRRLEAQDTLGLWLAAGFWLPGLGLLLATALGGGWLVPLGLYIPWHWRRQALRSLNVEVDVEARLHRALRQRAPEGFKQGLMERLEAEGLIRTPPGSGSPGLQTR